MRKILAILLLTLGAVSCKKSEEQLPTAKAPSGYKAMARFFDDNTDHETVLGPQKVNPYTLENMTAAFQALSQQGTVPPQGFNIHATHNYIKYKPQDWDQYAKVHEDSTHVYFDYPLDREILIEGNAYHDPSLADSAPQYLYAAIEAGFNLNNGVPYEIISPLYLPERDQILYETGFLDSLLDAAYVLTGNLEDTIKHDPLTGAKISSYRPGGKIELYDNHLQQNIGMEGVLVTARRWFVVFKGRPDYGGNYQVNGTYNRPCNYRLHFEDPRYNVRQTFFNIICYVDGPKTSSGWSTQLGSSSGQTYNSFVGHIYRGAWYYHYKNIDGLLRPYHGGATAYIAKNTSGISGRNLGYLMRLWRYNNSGNLRTDDAIFSTTIHETAHLTHFKMLGSNPATMLSVAPMIRESWATCVEWWLVKKDYQSRGIASYGEVNYTASGIRPSHRAYQYWNPTVHSEYTSLFIDCIDTYNQYLQPMGSTLDSGRVQDRVGRLHPGSSGTYTIAQLEIAIVQYSMFKNDVKYHLKQNKPFNVTDTDIDDLMALY